MKYRALVVENDSSVTGCPYEGCIKIVCPDLLGYKTIPNPSKDEGKSLVEKMLISGWVRPHYNHPMDFYLPEKGEGVYVEMLNNSVMNLIWTGFYPGSDFLNFILSEANWKGINRQKLDKQDRIYGTRNGSYIKIEDKVDGKIIIEVLGPTNRGLGDTQGESRKGCKITMDSLKDTEYVELLGTNKDGSSLQSIKIDMTKNSEKIVITDKASQTFTMDSTTGSEKITLVDKASQKIEMSTVSGAEQISLTAKNNVKAVLAGGLKKIDFDDGMNKVSMDNMTSVVSLKAGQLTEVKLDGLANKIKITNGIFNLKGVLDDLITDITSITTTGSPATHSINPASVVKLLLTKALKIDILLDG